MKKYEAPVVELTKFDVEDVITASALDPTLNTSAAADDIKAYAELNAGSAEAAYNDVFSW